MSSGIENRLVLLVTLLSAKRADLHMASSHFVNQKSTFLDILRPKRKIVEHPNGFLMSRLSYPVHSNWCFDPWRNKTQTHLRLNSFSCLGIMQWWVFGFSASYFPCQHLFSSWYWQDKKILASLLTVVAEAENKWPGPHLLALVSTFSFLKIIMIRFNRQGTAQQNTSPQYYKIESESF